jgi:predicted DNA-binding transcriptional regulator
MLEKLLVKLGLSEKDARVYLATLELGQATTQEISKKSNVVRPTTYLILEKLMKTGLVSTVVEGKKTKFVAENPQELANLLENQKHQIEIRRKELDESMNQLQAIYNASGDKPIVRYFEGADGLVALDKYGHDKYQVQNGEMLSISPHDILERDFGDRRKEAVRQRVASNIKSRVIYVNDNGPMDEQINLEEKRTAIYLSRKDLPIDTTFAIYSWGVKIFYLNLEKPYGILIEDPKVAINMKHFFELAWLGAQSLIK